MFCSVCLERQDEAALNLRRNDFSVCNYCVKILFQRAIDNEQNYPPNLGNGALRIADYVHILGSNFVESYSRKEKEYSIPALQRMHCPQGHFMPPLEGSQGTTHTASTFCHECQINGYICFNCQFSSFDTTFFGHDCTAIKAVSEAEDRRAFGDLIRGKDYQLCPHCNRKIELAEACNHIRCVCNRNFCYVCGKSLKRGDTKHFAQFCPIYGQPSNDRNRSAAGLLAFAPRRRVARRAADLGPEHLLSRVAEGPPAPRFLNPADQTDGIFAPLQEERPAPRLRREGRMRMGDPFALAYNEANPPAQREQNNQRNGRLVDLQERRSLRSPAETEEQEMDDLVDNYLAQYSMATSQANLPAAQPQDRVDRTDESFASLRSIQPAPPLPDRARPVLQVLEHWGPLVHRASRQGRRSNVHNINADPVAEAQQALQEHCSPGPSFNFPQ